MKRKISLIQRFVEKLIGRKFYVCIVGYKGSNRYFVNSDIYRTKQAAMAYQKRIETECPSLLFIGIFSFRSKNDFCLKLSVGDLKPQNDQRHEKVFP